MNDEQAPPVKGIIKALHRGTVLTKRICKTAKDQPAAHMLDISESAQSLERSLVRSEGSVRDAYAVSLQALGRKFVNAIEGDGESPIAALAKSTATDIIYSTSYEQVTRFDH